MDVMLGPYYCMPSALGLHMQDLLYFGVYFMGIKR